MIKVHYKFQLLIVTAGIVGSLFYSQVAFAQSKTYNEEITVIATFDPIIPDAFKINQNPAITDTNTTVPVLTYTVMPHDAGIQLDIDPLPAVKLVAEPLSKIYRNYIKGGIGNYSTLYGELFASSLRSKSYLLGVHMKHLSSSGNIKDYGPSANSNQVVEMFGQKYFPEHTLSGKVFFNREGLHLYGYKPSDFHDTVISKDDLKQRYMQVGGEMNFSSAYKSQDKLNHNIRLSYYNLTDLYKVKENNILVSADLDKKYDLFNLDTKQTLGLNTSVNVLSQRESGKKANTTIVLLNPYIKANYNEYSFKAGFDIYVAHDSATASYIYPILEAKLDLIPGGLQLYAGIDGGIEQLTVKSLSDQNPYLSPNLVLSYCFNKFRAYGGFNSNISRSFNFNGSISSTTFENYPFFITDASTKLNNTFILLYDDISVMKLKAEIEFVKAEKLKLSLSGGYYNYYKLGSQAHAWYKPDYDAAFAASYNMQDKIILKLRAGINGPVWALVPNMPENPKIASTPTKFNGWADISLGAEYRFNKALSFWLNLNNLTNNQHLYWHNYPSYRLNLLAGLSYSF